MEILGSKPVWGAAADWAVATGVFTAVFGFSEQALLGSDGDRFCTGSCPLAAGGRCDPQVAHRFGCYEAERWDGQFVYYCPGSLIFVATLAYEAGLPSYGLVSGPNRPLTRRTRTSSTWSSAWSG